jgi:hypothetical protein
MKFPFPLSHKVTFFSNASTIISCGGNREESVVLRSKVYRGSKTLYRGALHLRAPPPVATPITARVEASATTRHDAEGEEKEDT